MIKKSISITDQQGVWIKTQIASGNFGNESEVFRDLIRKEQAHNAEIETIRLALIEAEARGTSIRTPEEIRLAAKKRLSENGQL